MNRQTHPLRYCWGKDSAGNNCRNRPISIVPTKSGAYGPFCEKHAQMEADRIINTDANLQLIWAMRRKGLIS